MKAFYTLFVLGIASHVFGVAPDRIYPNGDIRLYNFSANPFPIANVQVSVDAMHVHTVSAAAAPVAPGEYFTVNVGSFRSSGNAPHSVAFWLPGTWPANVSSFAMFAFVQWGVASQPFELHADTAGYWVAGTFIPGEPPFERDTNYTSFGAEHWSQPSSGIASTGLPAIKVGPNPFNQTLTIQTSLTGYRVMVTNVTGSTIWESVLRTGSHDIPTDSWPAGAYLVAIRDEQGLRQVMKVLRSH